MKKNKNIMYMFVLLSCLFINTNVYAIEEIPVCENPEILKVIYFISIIIDIVKIIIPIGLIVMAMVDFSKGVVSNNEGDNKKNLSRLIKRFVYAVLIFAIPWIVKIVIINLGNLTKDVNYTDCLENATEERIKELQPIYDAWLAEQEAQSGSSGSTSSDNVEFSDDVKVKIKYSDDVIENLAAFIGSEAGAETEGFEAQLMTGAIFINNLYYDHDNSRKQIVTKPEQINKTTMCKMFKHGNAYSADYCDINFTSKSFSSKQRNQLTVAAKLVLSGIFTIPKQINGQGKMKDWNGIAKLWGYATTRSGCNVSLTNEDGCSQVYSYSIYYTITGEDIYGNTVSTNFDDYKAIADSLYQKYVVEGKDIYISSVITQNSLATGYLKSPLNKDADQNAFIKSIGDNSLTLYYKKDGPMKGKYHGGTDLPVGVGNAVYAMDGGTIYKVQDSCGNYGRHIIIQHIVDGKKYYTIYAHLNSIESKYKTVGVSVAQGDKIAYSGNTYHCGETVDPHLHVGISYNSNGSFPQTSTNSKDFLLGNFIGTNTKYSIVDNSNLKYYQEKHY